MKKLIYQVYLGKENNLYNFCTDSVKKYAKKIGADYVCQKHPILKIAPDPVLNERIGQTGGWKKLGYMPIFEKENVFNYFNDYDVCVVIDADIFIPDHAPDIFDDFDESYTVASVYESDLPINDRYAKKIKNYSKMMKPLSNNWQYKERTGYSFFNSGVMLYNSKKMLEVLNDMTPMEFLQQDCLKDFINGKGQLKWQSDQITLNYWFDKNNIKVQRLNWKWNALYTAVLDQNIKESYFLHFFLKDKLPNRGENINKLVGEIYA